MVEKGLIGVRAALVDRVHERSPIPSPVRAALSVVLFFVTFLVAASRNAPGSHHLLEPSPTQLWVATSVVATASAMVVWTVATCRWPLFGTALLGYLLLAAWPTLCVASFVAARTMVRRGPLIAFTIIAGVTVLLPDVLAAAVRVPDASWSQVLGPIGGVALFVGLPLVIGLWINAREQVVAGLHERAEELERSQAVRAEQARAEERARLAREMHDVVAHQVSMMVLHAGALEVNARDEITASAAALIRTTGREALSQLREILGVLRSPQRDAGGYLDGRPLLRDLDRLLNESRSVGIQVTHRREGQPYPLPAMVEHTVYRIIQEALTNVRKHAGLVATEVVLRYLPTMLEVTVENAAVGTVEGIPGSGMGLLGLRERVELLDGELLTRQRPDGGFRVSARLPSSAPEAGGPVDPHSDR